MEFNKNKYFTGLLMNKETKEKLFDVFISYKRDGKKDFLFYFEIIFKDTQTFALLLYEKLAQLGLKIFLDLRSLEQVNYFKFLFSNSIFPLAYRSSYSY